MAVLERAGGVAERAVDAPLRADAIAEERVHPRPDGVDHGGAAAADHPADRAGAPVADPDFVVDVSTVYEKEKESLEAYKSQFTKQAGSVDTPLTNNYIPALEARERLFGKEVGVLYAEGFKVRAPLLLNRDLLGE